MDRAAKYTRGAYLGQLKVVEVEALHDRIANDIGGSEYPAPSTALLVSDGASLEINDIVEDKAISDVGCTGSKSRPDVRVGQDDACQL